MSSSDKLSVPQFKRILYIHQQISDGKFPNCKSLADDLECSEMTIYRDKELLINQFNADIEFDYYKKGFYYSSPFTLPLLETFTEKEIGVLATAKILLSHYKNTPIYEKAEQLINNICAYGDVCKYEKNFSFLNRIAVAPVVMSDVNSHLWNVMGIAMDENRAVSFDYYGSSWDPDLVKRTVYPYQLLFDDSRCFLFGYLEEKKDVRLFKMEKIKNIVILTKRFTLPEVYEFEKLCGGGKFGAFTRFQPKKYKIAFYEDARESIRNGFWAEDQIIEEDDENDCTIITFTSCQDMRILDWVFKNKAYAVPLEPPEFVKRWKYNIKVMAEEAGIIEPDGVGFYDFFPEERPE